MSKLQVTVYLVGFAIFLFGVSRVLYLTDTFANTGVGIIPTFKVKYLGNGTEALIAPSGLKYFKVPVNFAVVVEETNNTDKAESKDSTIRFFIDGVEFHDVHEITEPGFYRLSVRVTNSAGEMGSYSEMIEFRENLNFNATASVESFSTRALDSETVLVEIIILLTSSKFDPCNIDLSTLALWLYDENYHQVGNGLLRMSSGYRENGEYDSSLISFEDCIWRLSILGEVPAGSMLLPNLRFYITGSGLLGEQSEFDFITQLKRFTIFENANESFLAVVKPSCDCD